MTLIDNYRLDDTDHDWTLRAACRGANPDLFFIDQGQSANPAKKVCARCPVSHACLDYAMRNDIRHGVWGGHGEKERKRLRGLRRKAAA